MGKRARIGVGVLVVAVYVFNPLYIRTGAANLASSITSFANLAPVTDPNSLKAAITNVTADFDQLSNILQDFFDRLPDNGTELLFRDFLSSKASRRHKDLERYLDWVLGFYRFAWPFLIVYIILRLSSGSSKADIDKGLKSRDRKRTVRKKEESYAEDRSPGSDNLSSNTSQPLGWQGRSPSAQSLN